MQLGSRIHKSFNNVFLFWWPFMVSVSVRLLHCKQEFHLFYRNGVGNNALE